MRTPSLSSTTWPHGSGCLGPNEMLPSARRGRLAASNEASLVDPKSLELSVQRRTLHADKLGGARDVATETADLGNEIFTLEDLACLAQRQAHELLAAIAVRH